MASPTSVTLLIPEETLKKMGAFYAEDFIDVNNQNALFVAKNENAVITAYKKAKDGFHKVLFQGENALYESSLWGKATPKEEKASPAIVRYPQIGSDEVGTGDFFGPITVAAAFVTKQDVPFLKELGVADSKTLTDDKIRQIGPKIIARIDYSQLCLPNEKYNEVHAQGLNMNAIKAKMHNRCLLNLKTRHPEAFLYVDQFAAPKTYFSYLRGEPEIAHDITFATKGESKFLSVATASVIARYSFLRHMDELSKQYGVNFPYGAGLQVDEFALAFAKKHFKDDFDKVAKTNFANYKKIPF